MAEWEADVATRPIPPCGNAWQESVPVTCVKGHKYALVSHVCMKKIEHKADEHECGCGRTWPRQ